MTYATDGRCRYGEPGLVSPRVLAIASHGITLVLDETGAFPMLIVTSPTPILGRIMVLCHELAGDIGAGITFEGPTQ